MLPAYLKEPDPAVFFGPAFDDRVTLDFETDVQVNYGHAAEPENGMLMGVWSCRGVTSVHWGDEYNPGWDRLAKLFETLRKRWGFIPLVAHNADYELAWIRRMGLAKLQDFLVWDTKSGEYVLMGNLAARNPKTGRPARSTSLDDCCRRRGWPVKDPIVDLYLKHGVNLREVPPEWVQGRCRLDVESTDRLFLDQRSRIASMGMLGVAFTRMIAVPFLTDVSMNGLCLDRGKVKAEREAVLAELESLIIEFEELTGGINWKSTPQVRDFLYNKLKFRPGIRKGSKDVRLTKAGELPTDKEAMAHCEATAKTKAQKRFVELRKRMQKLKASRQTLDFFWAVCEEKGGIFFGEFLRTRTATHRLASQGRGFVSKVITDDSGKPKHVSMQLQNLANEQKSLFTARREGWLVIEADGAQIEFRVGGFLGDDAQIRADIEDPDFDAHCTSAAEMYQIDYSEFLEKYRAGDPAFNKMRKSAKPHTFKPFYGGEMGTEAEERWYRAFNTRYSGLAAAQAAWNLQVINDKQLITPWGLRYYWPEAKAYPSGRSNVKNQVANYPIQALATAEIVPVANVYLWHMSRELIEKDLVLFVNTVHDSGISEIDPEVQEEYTEMAKIAYTTEVYRYLDIVYGLTFDLPLGVGVSAASHWGEGPENAWDIYPDGRERKR